MDSALTKHTIRNSAIMFVLCLAVHAFEVLVLRTDETIFAECFVNKVFGIVLLFVVLRVLRWHWRDIGFVRQAFLPNVLKGAGLCAVFYAIAFAAEFLLLHMQGTPAHFELYVTGFSLTGEVARQTGPGFVLMCIALNVINVWMEEGLFRGFFITYIAREHSARVALYVPALLFGLIQANPHITLQEMADTLNRSKRAIEMQVKKLREQGIIRRVGADKNWHWELVEE